MNEDSKGTFSPIGQLLPDPNEPDWNPPDDLPTADSIETSFLSESETVEASQGTKVTTRSSVNSDDQIAASLGEMLNTISSMVERVNAEGAELFKNSKYIEATQKADHGKALSSVREKLLSIQREWAQVSLTMGAVKNSRPSQKFNEITPNQRQASKKVSVIFEDGTVISGGSAADVFVRTIATLGLNKVQKLGIMRYGIPLVSDEKPERYTSLHIDGLYVLTHFNTADKRTILKKVSDLSGVNFKVVISG